MSNELAAYTTGSLVDELNRRGTHRLVKVEPECPFKVGDWVQPSIRDYWKEGWRAFRVDAVTPKRELTGRWQNGKPAVPWPVEDLEPYAPEPGEKVVVTWGGDDETPVRYVVYEIDQDEDGITLDCPNCHDRASFVLSHIATIAPDLEG